MALFHPLRERIKFHRNDVTSFGAGGKCDVLAQNLGNLMKEFILLRGVYLFREHKPGLANFSYKGPDNKYSSFCRPYGLCHNFLTLPLKHENSHTQYLINECGCMSIKLYLQKTDSGLE